jgi:uncharacterized protein YdhG (YjbR/CyaY superfamily)
MSYSLQWFEKTMMHSKAKTIEAYLAELPKERQEVMRKLRQTILENLPVGFQEIMQYGMIGYVVPHSIYPKGYHADPKQPLPFLNLASQKNHVAIYHMGIYSDQEMLSWFLDQYKVFFGKKPDMGKSCIRFKKIEEIPYEMIGELVSKMTVQEWVKVYESKWVME